MRTIFFLLFGCLAGHGIALCRERDIAPLWATIPLAIPLAILFFFVITLIANHFFPIRRWRP